MSEINRSGLAYDYPIVTLQQLQASLENPYPVWFLSPHGEVEAANLLSMWLWTTSELKDLLGVNAFDIFTRNLKRIPRYKNREFFAKKSAVVKRLFEVFGRKSYLAFISAMKSDPYLREIFDWELELSRDEWECDREWKYPLRLLYPDAYTPTVLMEFQVTVSRLESDLGYLAVYEPNPGSEITRSLVEREYHRIMAHSHEQSYIQYLNVGVNTLYPLYYPSLAHDPLWRITAANEAFKLSLGSLLNIAIIDLHLLEMLFSGKFRELLGAHSWLSSALRAVKYFDEVTYEYTQPKHEKYEEYTGIIRRLERLPDFREIRARSANTPIKLPANRENPFTVCSLFVPCPFTLKRTMFFSCMIQLVRNDLFGRLHETHYHQTSLPENQETKVMLILLHLTYTQPDSVNSLFEQLLWGLAIIQTVEQGLTRAEDTSWEPEPAFWCIRKDLLEKFVEQVEDRQDTLTVEIRIVIEMLQRMKLVDKESFLELLLDFSRENPNLSQLRSLLITELLVERGVRSRAAQEEVNLEEVLPFDFAFQEKFREAILSMIGTPQYHEALACFRAAYVYRKRFPWLPESSEILDEINQNGLSYALRTALSTYIVPEASSLEAMDVFTKTQDFHAEDWERSEAEWVSALVFAVGATISEGFSLKRFENQLTTAGIDVTAISPATLRVHIAAALVRYSNRRNMGISRDPL